MKRWVTMACAACLLCGMLSPLTGCNVKKQGEGAGEAGGDLSVVSFYEVWMDDPSTAVGAAKAAYEKEYGAKVNYKTYPYDIYNNKLVQMIAGGNSPDLIVGYWGDMPKLAATEVLQPIDDYVDLEKLNYPEIIDSYMWKGKHYAANIQQVQTPLLWFNKKMLEKEGIQKDPYELWKEGNWNWDTFKEIGLKLTKDTNNDGEIDQWGFASINSGVFQWSNGASYIKIDDSGNVRIAWKDPECLRALQAMQDARFKDVFYAPDPTLANTGFDEGKLGMVQGTFEYLAYNAKSFDPNDVGVAPFPQGPDFPGYYYGVTNLFGIARGAKNPTGAGRLCEMISEKEDEMFGDKPNLGNPTAEAPLNEQHREVIEWAINHTRINMDEGWGDWGYKIGELQNRIFWEPGDIVTALDEVEPILKAQIEDTLNYKIPVVGDFTKPAPADFENDLGFMSTEQANGLKSEITKESSEVVAGSGSLKLESNDIMQVMAYSDKTKAPIPSYKTYKVTIDYKILSAAEDSAQFAVTMRTMENLTTDVDQIGWFTMEGAAGTQGTVEGEFTLSSPKEYVLTIVSGMGAGSIAIDNIDITDITETE